MTGIVLLRCVRILSVVMVMLGCISTTAAKPIGKLLLHMYLTKTLPPAIHFLPFSCPSDYKTGTYYFISARPPANIDPPIKNIMFLNNIELKKKHICCLSYSFKLRIYSSRNQLIYGRLLNGLCSQIDVTYTYIIIRERLCSMMKEAMTKSLKFNICTILRVSTIPVSEMNREKYSASTLCL